VPNSVSLREQPRPIADPVELPAEDPVLADFVEKGGSCDSKIAVIQSV
jgi:hypothetical protein